MAGERLKTSGELFRRTPVGGEPSPWSPWLRLAHDFLLPPKLRRLEKPLLGDHALHYFLEGAGVYELGGQTFKIEPGKVFLVRPGEGYKFLLDPDVEVRMLNLHFDIEELPESRRPFPCPDADWTLKKRLPDAFPSVLALADRAEYEALFGKLLDAAWLQGRKGELRRKALLLELLAFLCDSAERAGVSNGRHQEAIEKALDMIDANPAGRFTLASLAAKAGVSRALLCEIFRKRIGETPQRYVAKRRVELASAELLYGAASIKEIATRCGFADVHHFTRIFKRFAGLPPAQFRERHRARQD